MSHFTLKPIRKSSKHVHDSNDWDADPRGNSRRTGSDFAMRVNRIQCLNSDPFSSSFYVGLHFKVTGYSSFLLQRHSDLSFTSCNAHRSSACQVKKPVQLLCAATLIMCHYHCSALLHVAFHRWRQTSFYTLAFLKWSLIYAYVGNGQGGILRCSIQIIHSRCRCCFRGASALLWFISHLLHLDGPIHDIRFIVPFYPTFSGDADGKLSMTIKMFALYIRRNDFTLSTYFRMQVLP